jgi:type 1 glutamine amidotransferase
MKRYFGLLAASVIGLTACSAAPDLDALPETTAEATPSPQVVASAQVVDDGFVWPMSYQYMSDDAVLVFSATQGWRHDSGIAASSAFWARLTDDNGRGFFVSEDPRIFTADRLSKFSVVVLNSPTGRVLDANQQAALQAFVENGGGLIAQHAAGDSSLADNWPWWEQQLGTKFVSHPADPQFQAADVVTLALGHPVMAGLGDRFNKTDEWYTFTRVPEGEVVILAGLDENTYSPVNKVYGVEDLRMGPEPSDHPIIWARCPGQGRVVYSALGHKADSYDNPDHRRLLTNALAWVDADQGQAGGEGCP